VNSPLQQPDVPAAIQPAPGQGLALIAHARGVQIYLRRPAPSGELAWIFKAPEALLYDRQGNVIGKHFAGPTWTHNDGSEITGQLSAKVDAPDAAAIPWLLLKVTGHSREGVFSRITSILRVNTVGGLPPALADGSSTGEAEFESSYAADYYFYSLRKI
jgi:hypothetical protein